MPYVDFQALPDSARLWIFGADRALADEERTTVLREVDEFIGRWQSHGTPVCAGRSLAYDRFLLIGVDEAATALSGCSIDGMVRRLKALESRIGAALIDRDAVFYRKGEEILSASRAEFHEQVDAGTVDRGTVVFDMTVSTVGSWRNGHWEAPAEATWHRQAFFEKDLRTP